MKLWKGWLQPHILERGRTYFDEGRVSELERTEDGYVAIVEGTEEYEVEILLEGDSVGDMEMLNRLKKEYVPAQWIEYRERYLSGRTYHKLELMESEGLWERLMKAVTASERLSILDRYEAALKKRYPDEMLEAYACILTKEAAAASDRKRYQELARYLKKLRSYPGGAERAARLAEDWRTRYIRRRAMMEELRNAGF